MQILEIEFGDHVAPLVEQLLDSARTLAGDDCVYKPLQMNELRAAITPATDDNAAYGVFLRISPTRNGAKAFLRKVDNGHGKEQEITPETLDIGTELVKQWFGFVQETMDRRDSGKKRNPAWTRDELILALDLYFRVPPWTINGQHSAVIELSVTLNALAAVERNDAARYRNPNGTYMKLMNLQFRDSSRGGRGLRGGGRLETDIWNDFAHDIPTLARVAAEIRAEIAKADGHVSFAASLPDGMEEAKEGRLLSSRHVYRERDRRLVATKKERVFASTGKLACEGCGFDFFTQYGEHGEGFIECHHTVPLADLNHTGITRLEDLALLCANCHRMVHRRKSWLRVEELKRLRFSAVGPSLPG